MILYCIKYCWLSAYHISCKITRGCASEYVYVRQHCVAKIALNMVCTDINCNTGYGVNIYEARYKIEAKESIKEN